MSEPRRTDTATSHVDASPAEVYAALMDPVALIDWLPPSGMVGELHEFEPSFGGPFRMTLSYADTAGAPGKTTAGTDVIEGSFGELVPGERVTWLVRFASADPAFAGVMRMTWLMQAAGRGCEVTIVAEDVPPGIRREDHDAGLRSSLANLAAFLNRE